MLTVDDGLGCVLIHDFLRSIGVKHPVEMEFIAGSFSRFLGGEAGLPRLCGWSHSSCSG